MATDNRLFSTTEADTIANEFRATLKAALAGPDGKTVVQFTRAWVKTIAASVAIAANAAAAKARRELAAEAEKTQKLALAVESLERRASRSSQHLSALETRLQKLEHGGKE